jgi:hypothetical protein
MRSSQTKTVRKTQKPVIKFDVRQFQDPDTEWVQIVITGEDAALRKKFMKMILQAVKILTGREAPAQWPRPNASNSAEKRGRARST